MWQGKNYSGILKEILEKFSIIEKDVGPHNFEILIKL